MLFPIEPNFPSGFSYKQEFITEEEEKRLIEIIKTRTLNKFLFHGYEASRKVESLGYDYHFSSRSISEGKEIPEEFNFLIEKVAIECQIKAIQFEEILLTEYPPQSVINWHRDAPPFELIAGISLLSDCIFKLRPHDEAKRSKKSVISFPVKRRSLYIMSGVSRNEWQHSISPVKAERLSITLRTLKKK